MQNRNGLKCLKQTVKQASLYSKQKMSLDSVSHFSYRTRKHANTQRLKHDTHAEVADLMVSMDISFHALVNTSFRISIDVT